MKLQQFTTFLGQWGWLILLGTAVAAGTAYVTSQNMTPVYAATATWLIDEPVKSETAVTFDQSLAQTYAVMAASRPVLAETIDRLDLPFSEEQLRWMVTAVVPDNTQIISIRVEDSDPGRTAMIANTIGEVLAEQSAARDSQRFAEPLANWQQQIDTSSAAIKELEGQLAATDVTNRSQLESDLAAAQRRYDDAFAQLNALLTQQAGESVMIMPFETAQAVTTPIRPRTAVATTWAAATGALAVLGMAIIVGRIRKEEMELVDTAVTTPPLPLVSND